jgi:hypothetical protein
MSGRCMKTLEEDIKRKMQRLRDKISVGDETEIFAWIIPGKLACSQRPLRDHPDFGGRAPLPPLPPRARPLVEAWVDRIVAAGIRSIICLLEVAQLDRYYVRGGLNLHEHGLLGYYESRGLDWRHFPLTDYQRPSEGKMKDILASYDELRKPVLMHCSAAIDRTTPVAAYIKASRG